MKVHETVTTYAYDAATGRLTQVRDSRSTIDRTYYREGTLRTERQRTYSSADALV